MDGDVRIRTRDGAGDIGAPVGNVDGVGLNQPDMAVDAAALVEPTFVSGGIHADHQRVLAAEFGILGDVEHEAAIAAGVATQAVAVKPDQRVAVNAVEFQP